MKSLNRLLRLTATLQLSAAIAVAQTNSVPAAQAAPEKRITSEKVWLEKIAKDASGLVRFENRAVVYARLGKVYWSIDKNRARQLFRQSVDELINARKEAELDAKASPQTAGYSLYRDTQTRLNVLKVIVSVDDALGFEMFAASRPEAVKKALTGEQVEPPANYPVYPNYRESLIQQENSIEQTLAASAISINPNRAIEIIRNDISGRPGQYTLSLLKSLKGEKPELAEKLTAELIRRLMAVEFKQNSPEIQIAYQIIADSTQNYPPPVIVLKVEPIAIHDLANKTADFIVMQDNQTVAARYTYYVPTLIKILPERAGELRPKAPYLINPTGEARQIADANMEFQRLIISNAEPEELFSAADKLPLNYREPIYMRAAIRMGAEGNAERAKEILTRKVQKERLKGVLESFYTQLANRATEKGEYDKALGYIDLSPEYSRFAALINIISAIQKKSPGDRQKAAAVLEKLRAMAPATFLNYQDFLKNGQIAGAYAFVEPETGFRLLQKLLDKYIEIADAAIITDSFRGGSDIRKNELTINTDTSNQRDFNVSFKNFAQVDFERTIKMMSRIKRLDVRLNLELQTLEGAFNLS